MPKVHRIVVVSQTFVPDPASVGQHMADVSIELARRGHDVRVYASARGYENAAVRYPAREELRGVHIRRFPLASFGKKHILLRVLGTAMFHTQAFFATLLTPGLDGIFFSTSPPLVGLPLCIVAMIRRVPVAYWAMDLNPDQLIAIGKLQPTSVAARALERINRFILRRAKLIVALDRFMADRIYSRGVDPNKVLVMPPWPHEDAIAATGSTDENPFRRAHHLAGKFVVMYSGNHSPSNPLTTLLQAAVRMKDDSNVMFLFVGGGHGKREVEQFIAEHSLTNVLSLPYQPLIELKHSLTAADVHVVSLGDAMVGIIHPCKIYGAMAAGRPILFLGPRPSHISDLLDAHDIGLQVSHGDVDAAERAVRTFAAMTSDVLAAKGERARQMLGASLGQAMLTAKFCDAVETALVPDTNGKRS